MHGTSHANARRRGGSDNTYLSNAWIFGLTAKRPTSFVDCRPASTVLFSGCTCRKAQYTVEGRQTSYTDSDKLNTAKRANKKLTPLPIKNLTVTHDVPHRTSSPGRRSRTRTATNTFPDGAAAFPPTVGCTAGVSAMETSLHEPLGGHELK